LRVSKFFHSSTPLAINMCRVLYNSFEFFYAGTLCDEYGIATNKQNGTIIMQLDSIYLHIKTPKDLSFS